MKKIITIILCASMVMAAGCCRKNSDTHLQRGTDPSSLDSGVQAYLQDLRDLGGTSELNSVMVLKDGKVIEEYYDVCYGPDFLNICWSASKTFTATAVGFAVQDRLLTVDDKVVDLLPKDKLPQSINDTLAALTVKNLLTMSSGFKLDPIGPTGSLKLENPTLTVLEGGFKFFPGEYFAYNSHNTYLLSEIVTNLTGKFVEDYLKEKLFEPLGIRNWHWDVSKEGYNMGGWGLYITTESLAKMGQFFLQKGKWDGRQLLDEKWIADAMSPQIWQRGDGPAEDDDWGYGYGYQMWCNTVGGGARLDGAHGQFSLICPDKNAVIVVTENGGPTGKMLKAIWKDIYDIIPD
jgi:Beta-lactamase class C and other penicillin binding proteins